MGRVITTKKHGPAKPSNSTQGHDWSEKGLRLAVPWLFRKEGEK